MSSSTTNSVPTQPTGHSTPSFVIIGEHPDSPDMIIRPGFSRYPASPFHGGLTGAFRPYKHRSHSLKCDMDDSEIRDELQAQLSSTTTAINWHRPPTGSDRTHQWVENSRAAWETEVTRQVDTLSQNSKRTLIICFSDAEYAGALFRYAAASLTEKEEDLLKKFHIFPKGPSTADGIDPHESTSQTTGKRPSSRIVDEYKAGHDYDSDPGSVRPECNDEWERRSQ